jgi:hypothetical protein
MGGISNHKGEDQANKSTERRITTGGADGCPVGDHEAPQLSLTVMGRE